MDSPQTTTISILNEYVSDLDDYVSRLLTQTDTLMEQLRRNRADLASADEQRTRIYELLEALQAPDPFDTDEEEEA